jgi:putative ABC transport system permease protein
MKSLRFLLSWQLLLRNWRSGELKILATALALAVAIVSAIAIFSDRLDQSISRQSNTYLAADRVVSSRFAIPTEWNSKPLEFSLQQSSTTEFSSMVFAGDEMQLAAVKAVGDRYPLRGALMVSQIAFAIDGEVTLAEGIPKKSEVWIDSRLLPLMNIELGDSLTIGNKDFVVSNIVISEPDAGAGFAVFGPRVMMNATDLAATGVIQTGSRVTYKWLLAGDENNLAQFEQWLEPNLGEHYRYVTIKNSQQNISLALERGTQFLMLSAIIGVLLASVAISITAQQFSNRHIDQVALLKSLGASAFLVRQLYFFQIIMLGVLASIVGISIGEILQRIIAASLSSLFSIDLVNASFSAYSVGLMTGLLCLACFALPPLWYLPKVSPLKVLRRELAVDSIGSWLKGFIGLGAIVLLVWIYSGDSFITLTIVASLIVIVLISALLALTLLHTSKKIGSQAGSYWRLALSNLQRYRTQNVTQILVFACALMLLMVLYSVRTSLIKEWQLQIPENAPNHFLLNIAESEKASVQALIARQNLAPSPLYPMVLGRLTAKNNVDFTEQDQQKSNALRRELNLSWSANLAANNVLTEGLWWDEWQSSTGLPGVSVEAEEALEIGLNIGDVISFSLGGLPLKAEIASIRSVDWNSMTPNFYFLFSPGALDQFSANFLTSVFVPNQQRAVIATLLKEYPTITVIEVGKIIQRIKAIIDQVSKGIELMLWLVLFGGVLVLVAAVNASMNSRMKETGLLRALGSGKQLILRSLTMEFATLGFIAGVIAVFGAETLLLGLQYLIFDGQIKPHYELWIAGPLLGAALIAGIGLLSCRKVVSIPPSIVLRELDM